MKKCPYCGCEYSDDTLTCAIDQNVLVSSGPQPEVAKPEPGREPSQPDPIKYFIVPIILWSYVLSVILGRGFWSEVYERLFGSSHWNVSQQLRFLVVWNLLVASIGAPQVLTFISALRRREMMSVSQHVGSSLCISAAALCVAAVFVCLTLLARQP
jgi:hypothetical protein